MTSQTDRTVFYLDGMPYPWTYRRTRKDETTTTKACDCDSVTTIMTTKTTRGGEGNGRQEGGGDGEVQRPREASMPRGEGVYGSSVDQSGKATGRVQGEGQGHPGLHPASSLLGSSPLPIKGAAGPVILAWPARYF